ncbi:MAG: exodeoxyribonuclease VII large subunit [Chloroflexota bacterium]|nr:exodeoxyribonuclease VII large subunit [Chloroflexota bacterium]
MSTSSPVYTVRELVDYLSERIAGDPQLRDLWLTGELSDLSRPASGHAYFTLRDGDGNSSFRCVLFANRSARGAEHLAAGAKVNAHGRVGVYAARGEIQLYVDAVMPAGLGAEAMALELLRMKLEEEGLFDPTRKRGLPPFPKRVGLVTSPSGAAYHDVVQTLARRYPLAEVVFAPASVQGDAAPGEIVRAIAALNAAGDVDVMIVGRGGGAAEDLAAFNTEIVARAIFGSAVPVVSAVGHETDTTIADFVADVRALTPTDAAVRAAPDARELAAIADGLANRAGAALRQALADQANRLEQIEARLERRKPDINGMRQRVDEALALARRALDALVKQRQGALAEARAALAALDPAGVLRRGYAALSVPASGAPVASVSGVSPGDVVRATLRDGSFDAQALPDESASKAAKRPPSKGRTARNDGGQPQRTLF